MADKKHICECGFSCRKPHYFNNHKAVCKLNIKPIVSNVNNLDSILYHYSGQKKYNSDIIENLKEWWTKYSDRIFMTSLYPKIGEYFSTMLNANILDIGFENYNVINKDLLNNSKINYYQIEPCVGDKIYNNDKLLEGFVENLLEEHKYFTYFDLVIDFGVLGSGVSKNWSEETIEKYIYNILGSLKDNGLYFLKIDSLYFNMDENKLDLEKFIYPYFDPITFFEYENNKSIGRKEDGRRPDFTKRDQYKFFFLKKKKKINNLVIVANPDDETIWCDEKLNDNTHVVVVFSHSKLGLDTSLMREKEFKNVMDITKCSYELWNFPEKVRRISGDIINTIKKNITGVLRTYNMIDTLYTHNIYGETGHSDHIRLHEIVKSVVCEFYSTNPPSRMPQIYEFYPQLNYKSINVDDRLKNILCVEETQRRKVLLDQYKSQTIDIFRNIKLDFKLMDLIKCQKCNILFNNSDENNKHNILHKTQENYFEKFNKKSLDEIEFINGVPKVVFVCWFGGYKVMMPLMSEHRFNAFSSLVESIKVPVILLTNMNIGYFEKSEHKFNKSFEYLHGVHKSDYIRAYILHHYGGGYHDIKWRNDSWENEWTNDMWLNNQNIWIHGRQEKYESAIGYPPGSKHIQSEYKKLVTMGWVICKKQTDYTKELLEGIDAILDVKYGELVKHPGFNSSGYYSECPFSFAKENIYPLRWLEIMGEISHPLMLKYSNKIHFGLPDAIKRKGYK